MSLRVTQAGALVRLAANQKLLITQAGAIVRVNLVQIRTTQAGALVRVALAQVRVSQAGVLVRVALAQETEEDDGALAGGGKGQRAKEPGSESGGAVRQPAAAQIRTVSAAAARAGNELFAALAASRAAIAPGTVMPAALGSGEGGGVSEVRAVSVVVEVDWNRDGNFTNENANLVSVTGQQSLMAPQQMMTSGNGMVDRCTVTLFNNANRYSMLNESSALAASIGEGKAYQTPVRVSVTIDGDHTVLFTGILRSISEEARTPAQAGLVKLECRSKDDLALQQRMSTSWADWATSIEAAYTEDWHIIGLLEAAGFVDGTDFVSQAFADANLVRPTIDNGIFPLPTVWLDDASVLEMIWKIVGACCGWFTCDAGGKMHYHNLAGVLPKMMERHYGTQTMIEIDESTSARLTLSWRDTDLLSQVTVTTTPLEPGESESVWTTKAPLVLQPNESRVIYARLSQPAAAALTLDWSAASAGGNDMTASVSCTRVDYAQRVKLTFTNNATRTAYISAKLTGQLFVAGDEQEVTKDVATETFWQNRQERSKRIANSLIASTSHAASFADYLLARCKLPVLTASITNLDDANVQVGRRCTVRYPGVVGAATEFDGLVMSANWTADKNGFRQHVEIMDTSRLFGGLDDFFVLGENRLGASGADTAPLFY